MRVRIRYFASARAAAGMESETLTVPPEATVADVLAHIGGRGQQMADILARCSYLCDGVALRDRHVVLRADQTVDVLPPFAGG